MTTDLVFIGKCLSYLSLGEEVVDDRAVAEGGGVAEVVEVDGDVVGGDDGEEVVGEEVRGWW